MRGQVRSRTRRSRSHLRAAALGLACALGASGCLSLTPQLQPANLPALEQIESREDREAAYERERIRMEYDPRGRRYFKGEDPNAPRRGWQSLDAVLRSDANSAAMLPEKKIRTSRILLGISMASSLVTVAGAAATAREALNLGRITGPGLILLSGATMSLSFGIGAGVTFGQARRGYEQAVDVYNESLGLRLGLYDAQGNFLPPPGTVLDEDGFMILRDDLAQAQPTQSGDGTPVAGNSVEDGEDEAPAADPAALHLGFRDLTSAPAR